MNSLKTFFDRFVTAARGQGQVASSFIEALFRLVFERSLDL